MSERAKIHLGDIQCECLKRSMDCEKGGVVCDYRPICHAIKNEMPLVWDLRDPPRFTEAQMAFWRGWYAIGARHACHMIDIDRVYMFDGSGAFPKVQLLSTTVDTGLKKGETLDLAELFGKDGAEC